MNAYSRTARSIVLLISLALLLSGLALSSWLWSNNWENTRQVFQLRIYDCTEMIESMMTTNYLLLILGLMIIQEMVIVITRYVLGLQGKRERLYILWKKKKFGFHHFHWGILLIVIGFICQLTNISTNTFLIALGISLFAIDILHHCFLKFFHGDFEGNGQFTLRN